MKTISHAHTRDPWRDELGVYGRVLPTHQPRDCGAAWWPAVAGDIEAAIGIPLIHIVDPTGEALAAQGIRRAGLLGTRYTMELPFWRERLRERYGIDLVVPDVYGDWVAAAPGACLAAGVRHDSAARRGCRVVQSRANRSRLKVLIRADRLRCSSILFGEQR